MANKTFLYIGAGVLLLIGVCLFGYGILSVIGSTSVQGSSSWLTFGIGFSCVGAVFLAGGIGLIVFAIRQKGPAGSGDNITYKIDLPGQTKVEQMTCKNCGGTLKADNVKMIAGAPTVECPFCGTVYQLTEEPKW
jgi:ABC-type transport system involved in multi-copper enzyme maturation permease subunit